MNIGNNSEGEEFEYTPDIINMTTHTCITCEYKYRYNQLMIAGNTLEQLPEGPEKDTLNTYVAQEMANILELGLHIAEERCKGNYMAAMSVFN